MGTGKKENKSGKLNQAYQGSKANNFETNTRTDDLALAESMLLVPEAKQEITDTDVEQAIVYENGATSIDFMMPEDEREILEKNLNNYSDMEKMQKALTMAKRNKLLSEEIRSLDQLEKIDSFINNMSSVLADETVQQMVMKQLMDQVENGEDITKSIKQLGLTAKAFIDAREGMISRLKTKKNGKNARIALKFTNGDGEETQIGVELDG